MFLDLRDNLNDLSVVERLSIVTSGKIMRLVLERGNLVKQSIYLSENDFLILLALF